MKKSKFHFSVELEQHTPLLHFQHDQAGAGLRATDVKARLDKFIIKQEGVDQCKHLLVGYSGDDSVDLHPALDYKLWVDSGEIAVDKRGKRQVFIANSIFSKRVREDKFIENEGYIPINNAPYFADAQHITGRTNDLKEAKKAIFLEHSILRFFSLNLAIQALVKKYLSAFFAVTNFGTRQTKGFGSFYLKGLSNEDFEDKLKTNFDVKALYSFSLGKGEGFANALDYIKNDYQLLKAGQNHRNYEKSMLWRYFSEKKDIRWEKRNIKQVLKNQYPDVFYALKKARDAPNNRILDGKNAHNHAHQYIRAVLGLAEQIEFGTGNRNDKISVKIYDKRSKSSDKRLKSTSIDRFASPITFKVLKNKVYLIGMEVPTELSRYPDGTPRLYTFSLDAEINRRRTSADLFDLPAPDNFNISEFLNFAMTHDEAPKGFESYQKLK